MHYLIKFQLKNNRNISLSVQQSLLYLELLHEIATCFEICRSSIVEVNFEMQGDSARYAELLCCSFCFCFLLNLFGDSSIICTLTTCNQTNQDAMLEKWEKPTKFKSSDRISDNLGYLGVHKRAMLK
jgi:hypothetical protein